MVGVMAPALVVVVDRAQRELRTPDENECKDQKRVAHMHKALIWDGVGGSRLHISNR
jgi:hypothetical protein